MYYCSCYYPDFRYILCTRSTIQRKWMPTHTRRRRKKKWYRYIIMLVTQRLETHMIIDEIVKSLLGSKAGNIGDDLCNFIFGEASKIIVHKLLDCWSPGDCLGVTKRTVTLKMFVTTVSFKPKKLGMIHICSVHPLICRNNNILLLKTWRMALYILAILRHYCSSIGGAPARYGTIFECVIQCWKYLREQWRFFYAVYIGSVSYFLQMF